MSNLISRKEAIEIIESLCTDGKMYGNDNITLIDAYEAIDRLAELATTYDVDKVLAKMEEYATNVDSDCDDVIYSVIDDLMLIVKGGIQ